jgi:hypothetical protein
MPLITPPPFVSNFLNVHGYDLNPNLLIIAENYPNPHFNGYFYRSLRPVITPSLPSFTREVFTNFGIPVGTEYDMLIDFLDGKGIGAGPRLLIDALPDGAAPVRPIAPHRLNDLITDILYINPNNILIMHNNNIDVALGLLNSPRFAPLIPRLLVNPNHKVHPNVFPFLSGRALPIHFSNALNAVRKNGIPI